MLAGLSGRCRDRSAVEEQVVIANVWSMGPFPRLCVFCGGTYSCVSDVAFDSKVGLNASDPFHATRGALF